MEAVEKRVMFSQKRASTVILDVLRSFAGPIFQPIWPLLVIYTADVHLWGKAVDVWFFASFAGIILSWGSTQYLQKRFTSFPNKVNDSFVESVYSRLPLLLIFLIFLAFSPYSPVICISYMLLFAGKFINQSFDALYVYQKNDWKPILANLTGLALGIAYYFYKLHEMSLVFLIFAIGIAEITKSVIHLLLNFKVFIKGKVSNINLEMYLLTYNFFLYSFSVTLILTIDRFFIYTRFEEADKAVYQIFMNFMIVIATLPNFVTHYFNTRDKRSKVKVDNNLRMKVLVGGLFVVVLGSVATYLISLHVFLLNIPLSFMAAGMLFAFPSTLYTPLVIHFYNKNNHGLLSRCAFGAGIAMLTSCTFFINSFGLIGGIYTCILGQWIFMFLVTIFYEQDQISKKIKLIK